MLPLLQWLGVVAYDFSSSEQKKLGCVESQLDYFSY